MSEHPIENLMITAMSSLRDMIDVNTIVGDTVEMSDGTVIIPVSKVSFGFAAGGSEFNNKNPKTEVEQKLPFGGRFRGRRKYFTNSFFNCKRYKCKTFKC